MAGAGTKQDGIDYYALFSKSPDTHDHAGSPLNATASRPITIRNTSQSLFTSMGSSYIPAPAIAITDPMQMQMSQQLNVSQQLTNRSSYKPNSPPPPPLKNNFGFPANPRPLNLPPDFNVNSTSVNSTSYHTHQETVQRSPRVIEKIVEKPVERIVTKEVPVTVEKIIEKVVYKDRIVEVPVDRVINERTQAPKPKGSSLSMADGPSYTIMPPSPPHREPGPSRPRATPVDGNVGRGVPDFGATLGSVLAWGGVEKRDVKVQEVGLGLALERDAKGTVFVQEIVPGFAGANSPIREQDAVESVGGIPVQGIDSERLKRLTMGREGTSCTLRLRRGEESYEVTLVRKMPDVVNEKNLEALHVISREAHLRKEGGNPTMVLPMAPISSGPHLPRSLVGTFGFHEPINIRAPPSKYIRADGEPLRASFGSGPEFRSFGPGPEHLRHSYGAEIGGPPLDHHQIRTASIRGGSPPIVRRQANWTYGEPISPHPLLGRHPRPDHSSAILSSVQIPLDVGGEREFVVEHGGAGFGDMRFAPHILELAPPAVEHSGVVFSAPPPPSVLPAGIVDKIHTPRRVHPPPPLNFDEPSYSSYSSFGGGGG